MHCARAGLWNDSSYILGFQETINWGVFMYSSSSFEHNATPFACTNYNTRWMYTVGKVTVEFVRIHQVEITSPTDCGPQPHYRRFNYSSSSSTQCAKLAKYYFRMWIPGKVMLMLATALASTYLFISTATRNDNMAMPKTARASSTTTTRSKKGRKTMFITFLFLQYFILQASLILPPYYIFVLCLHFV